MIRPLLPLVLLPLAACIAGGESGDPAFADCSDPDDVGRDTGDIPGVAGDWTSSFTTDYWKDNCTVSDFDETTEDWIGAFTVKGAYNNFSASFHDTPDETLTAALDLRGGFTMSGEHAHDAGTLFVNFGGLVHFDAADPDRARIDGSAYLGMDVDKDNTIDCAARASWTAIKSGL